MQSVLEIVYDWMFENHLKLNEDKTKILLIRNRAIRETCLANSTKITFRQTELNFCDEAKNLGVIFDENLSFEKQVSLVVRNANFHLRQIGMIKKYLSVTLCLKVIYNLVLSRIDYCNSLYYNLPNYLLNKLQVGQNKAARLLMNISRRERITPVLMELHWLPVKDRII